MEYYIETKRLEGEIVSANMLFELLSEYSDKVYEFKSGTHIFEPNSIENIKKNIAIMKEYIKEIDTYNKELMENFKNEK